MSINLEKIFDFVMLFIIGKLVLSTAAPQGMYNNIVFDFKAGQIKIELNTYSINMS